MSKNHLLPFFFIFIFSLALVLPLISSSDLTSSSTDITYKGYKITPSLDGKNAIDTKVYDLITLSNSFYIQPKDGKPYSLKSYYIKTDFNPDTILDEVCTSTQFKTECKGSKFDDTKFMQKNNVTREVMIIDEKGIWWTIENWFKSIFGLKETPAYTYVINYTGIINDTDPSFFEVITTSTLGSFNRTEASSNGVRNLAPVLFMDFNNPSEATNNNNISYIKDNSIYNNFGLTGNSTGGTNATYNSTGGYDGSGAYTFDGVDDVITASATYSTTYTISGWIKNSTATSWSHIVWSSSGINYTNGLVSNPNQKPFNWTRIGQSGATYFNGTIDQVQIFNYALTSADVLNLYNGTRNNSNFIGKYANQGDYTSGIFYNITQTYWNLSLSIADTTSSRSGLVNTDNSINISEPSLVGYWALDGNGLDAKSLNNGTLQNGVYNGTGLVSNALNFDGVNDFMNMTISYTSGSGYNSTSLWIKSSSSNNWQHIAYNGTAYFLNGVAGTVENYPINRRVDWLFRSCEPRL